MMLIISGRPERVASFEVIADHAVEQHAGWKLVGAVRVATELGGVFHALVFDLGGARTALFWDRGSVKFATAQLWGSKGEIDMHNVVCSCSECQIARSTLAPGEAVKGLDDLSETDQLDLSEMDRNMKQLESLQLRLGDVEERLRLALANQVALERELAEIVAKLGELSKEA